MHPLVIGAWFDGYVYPLVKRVDVVSTDLVGLAQIPLSPLRNVVTSPVYWGP
jgi:hypothetical protein